jgi:hypothetical protein
LLKITDALRLDALVIKPFIDGTPPAGAAGLHGVRQAEKIQNEAS